MYDSEVFHICIIRIIINDYVIGCNDLVAMNNRNYLPWPVLPPEFVKIWACVIFIAAAFNVSADPRERKKSNSKRGTNALERTIFCFTY
jgi:hypothetical protein